MLSPALLSALLVSSPSSGWRGGAEAYLAPGSAEARSQVQADASAPSPEMLAGPDFLLLSDTENVSAVCVAQGIGERALLDAVEGVRVATGIDPQIAIVLTTVPIGCENIFYLPVANDAHGIGYQHVDPREVFDDSPNSRLEGIAFLNDFPYWAAHPEEFAKDFNHEVAHRWGARVHARINGADSSALLGRQLQHWSYFLDTQGSPLEGNIWAPSDTGRFVADTPLGGGVFSDFDLYLMGVLPRESVASERLLQAPESGATDCKGNPLSAASPPQWCTPLDVKATAVPVSIDDVIAVEGERDPPAEDTTKTVDVAVFVVRSSSDPLDAEDCDLLSSTIARRVDDFARAAGGRVTLHNLTASNASCSNWGKVIGRTPAAGDCALEPRPRTSAWSRIGMLLAVFVLWRRRVGSCWRRGLPLQ